MKAYRIVQPWGRDKVNESTVVRTCGTIEAAFNELDRMVAEMIRTGSPSDAVELIVLDSDGRIVRRPNAS
jgi:hypothetical protein